MAEIYKVTNKTNGKICVGQTINSLEKRKSRHLNDAKYSSKNPVHRVMRKYRVKNFIFEIAEECNINDLNNKKMR